MNETVIGTVDAIAKSLKLDITGAELAQLSIENGYTQEQLDAVNGVFTYLKEKKDKSVWPPLLPADGEDRHRIYDLYNTICLLKD